MSLWRDKKNMKKDAENPSEQNTRGSSHIPKALKTENRV